MAQWDQIQVDGSPMRLYVGMPSLGRAFPAVIVIQHGPGVDRFIEDRVETLSQQGYLAIAPDLYHRQTEDGDMMTRIGRLQDPEVISDVNGTKWSSATGAIQVEFARRKEAGATTASVADKEKKVAGRTVTYSVVKPDFFVLSGTVEVQSKRGDNVRLEPTYGIDVAPDGTMAPEPKVWGAKRVTEVMTRLGLQ